MIKNKFCIIIIFLSQLPLINAMERIKYFDFYEEKKEKFRCGVNEYIAEKGDLNQKDADLFLEHAVKNQLFDVAENLLKCGVNTESSVILHTLLYYTVKNNH